MGRLDQAQQFHVDLRDVTASFEECDDPRDAFALLQERIDQYRRAGWSVPENLIRIERQMMADFIAESQGR